MAYFRFHKSRTIIPEVKVNVTKSGPSVSIGPRGAKINIGPQGVRTTVGIPGSGLSVINRTAWNSVAKSGKSSSPGAGNQQDNEAVVNSLLDGMTKEQQREFFTKCVMESSLTEVKEKRDAFEQHVPRMSPTLEKMISLTSRPCGKHTFAR